MFSNIFDLGFRRSFKQAAGFYLFFLVALTVAGGIVGGVTGMWILDEKLSFEIGLRIGATVAVFASLLLSTLVVRAKSNLGAKTAILAVLSGILALFGGALLGLLPVAYLTTLPGKGDLLGAENAPEENMPPAPNEEQS